MLGLLQWFDLLNRLKLSIYTTVYGLARECDDWVQRELPGNVRAELLAAAVLGVFWGVDMRVPHLEFVRATNASDEFGMGGCIARVPRETCVELAGVSERDGEYVTIAGIEPKPRSHSLGAPHHMDLSTDAFATMFSIRCHESEHINLREARALVHYLKWVLRS